MSKPSNNFVLVIADSNGFERMHFGMTKKAADKVASLLPREGGAVYVAELVPNAKRAPDMSAQGEMCGQERWFDAVTFNGKVIRYV